MKKYQQSKAAASRTQLGEEDIVVCEAMDGMGNATIVAVISCLELQFWQTTRTNNACSVRNQHFELNLRPSNQ